MTNASSRRGRTRVLRGAVLLAVGAVVAMMAWRALTPAAASGTAEPTYEGVVFGTYVESVPAPGTLHAWRRHDVRAATGGTITWVAEVGARVEAGEVLARLDPVPLERDEQDARLAFERAQRQLANVRQDQVDVERTQRNAVDAAERSVAEAVAVTEERSTAASTTQRLAELGTETPANLRAAQDAAAAAVSDREVAQRDLVDARATRDARLARAAQDVLDAEASLEQAEVALARAREDLATVTLRAPYSGIVDAVDSPAGSVVNANAVVLAVADDERLVLATQVDETEIVRITRGLLAAVSVTAMPGQPAHAEVTAISPSARTVQNIPVFDVSLEVPNPSLTLRPGMTAEADIVLREVEGTFTVPSRAVRPFAVAGARGAASGDVDAEGRGAPRVGFGDGLPDAAAAQSARAALGSGTLDAAAIESAREAFGAAGGAEAARGARGDAAGLAARAGASARSDASAMGSVRVRTSDGEVHEVLVEIVATVGGSMVLRGDVPAGAEIEVPPLARAAGATGGATGLPFNIGGRGGIAIPGAGAFR